MRRVVSSLLAGFAALAATVAWTSFAAGSTVLDPGRTGRVADVLMGDPAVREAVEDALVKALIAAVPANSPVADAELRVAAHRALDDPRVLAVVRVAIVDAHRRLVGEGDGPVRVDAGPIAAAGRDALLDAHPELARHLRAPPPLAVELPTDGFPDLGRLREAASGATRPAAQAAALMFAAAFVVAAARGRILRRVGVWALWAGGGWVALGWAAPWVVSRFSVDGHFAVLGSLAVAVVGPMIVPAAVLAVGGVAALAAASAWPKPAAARLVFRSDRLPVAPSPRPSRRSNPARRVAPAPPPIIPGS